MGSGIDGFILGVAFVSAVLRGSGRGVPVGGRRTPPGFTRTPTLACGTTAHEAQSKGRGNASGGEATLAPPATGDPGSVPIERETVESVLLLGVPEGQAYNARWRHAKATVLSYGSDKPLVQGGEAAEPSNLFSRGPDWGFRPVAEGWFKFLSYRGGGTPAAGGSSS